MAINPQFLADLESTIEYLAVDRYTQATSRLEYDRFTKVDTAHSLRQIVKHREPFATLVDDGETGGSSHFDDARILESSFSNHYAKGGFELTEQQMTDLDEAGIAGGDAVNLAADWARDIGGAEAYFPQRRAVAELRGADWETGQNITRLVYDGKALFATDHPVKVGDSSKGSWSNLMTGAVSGNYPGFQPIAGPFAWSGTEWVYDATAWITPEQGLQNLHRVLAAIGTWTLPDGVTPAMIRPSVIVHSPFARMNVNQMTDSKFIAAQSAGGGGGATEIEGMMTRLGFSKPLELAELGIARTYAGTPQAPLEQWDYFLIDEDAARVNRLGLINFRVREPFGLKFFNSTNSFAHAVSNKASWLVSGRYGCAPAIPYFGIKVQAPSRV